MKIIHEIEFWYESKMMANGQPMITPRNEPWCAETSAYASTDTTPVKAHIKLLRFIADELERNAK